MYSILPKRLPGNLHDRMINQILREEFTQDPDTRPRDAGEILSRS